jgi:uncharacterized protein YaiI (UPF0178 family)
MRIFVDGDAFPNLLKPIVVRAIERVHVPLILVSNKTVHLGSSGLIKSIIVEAGADEADHRIVMTGGPKPFGPKDAHAFANALHRFLTKHCKQ